MNEHMQQWFTCHRLANSSAYATIRRLSFAYCLVPSYLLTRSICMSSTSSFSADHMTVAVKWCMELCRLHRLVSTSPDCRSPTPLTALKPGMSQRPCPQSTGAPVYMPPDDMKMTREGAERLSAGSNSRVRWNAPRVLVAKLSSNPSADVALPSLDCVRLGPLSHADCE